MSYSEIINLIFTILTTLIGLITVHYVIFTIIGVFCRKKFPKSKVQHKYGVLVSARNEGKVIGNLIDSIRNSDYPQDKIEIFVMAHNCTDNTAEIAREKGVVVYEYNNDKERTKGFALKRLFECLNRDYDVKSSFDGFFMFDADNVITSNYIEKMNDAFDYYNCNRIVTSFRNSKNFGTNAISASYGLLFVSGCRLESRARTICDCSSRVQGTGFIMPAEIVAKGWEYVTLTEDWELSADQITKGTKIMYCDEAEFFDEQPTNVKIMFRQRIRWAKGHFMVFFTKSKQLFCNLFRKNKKDEPKIIRFSSYDILTSIMPFYVITSVVAILQFLLLAIAPIFEPINVGAYWINWLKTSAISLATAYVGGALSGVLLFVIEHKRIPKMKLGVKIAACLFWPIFIALNLFLDYIALFSKNVTWKEIPHVHVVEVSTLKKQSDNNNQLNETAEKVENETNSEDENVESEVQKTDVVDEPVESQDDELDESLETTETEKD